MRKHILKLPIALCALFCCTACFDIQENLFLRKDGSGTFSFILNMSEIKYMMSMFDDAGKISEGNDDLNERKSKDRKITANDQLNSTFENTKHKLQRIEGITKVKIIDDTTGYNFGVSFDFINIDILNAALNKLFEDESDTTTDKKSIIYFELKDNQLIRQEALDTKSILGQSTSLTEKSNPINSENPFLKIDQLFGTVSYSTNYEFENKIIASKNENSMLSANMQKVSLKIYPFATVKDSNIINTTIGNTITFK